MTTKLGDIIKQQILTNGAISLADYMKTCLTHPQHGYYTSQDPIGDTGDFITAPEISQIFGELIAIWLIQTWQQIGQPQPIQLIELGPGRGSLMRDILKVFQQANLLSQVSVHLVECNPILRQQQAKSLEIYPLTATWHDDFANVPHGNSLVIANEFLDALPIQQFIKTKSGWRERMVDLKNNDFCLTASATSACKNIPKNRQDDKIDSIYEFCPQAQQVFKSLAQHNAASLWIDYGYDKDAKKDTFQAIKSHQYSDPFKQIGRSDLTAHVNFPQLASLARSLNLVPSNIITQGQFLGQMGIGLRTKLLAEKQPQHSSNLLAATNRLTAPNQMGDLFKCMAIMPKNHGAPYGF